MILLIDNYDSFVYNLARYVGRLGRARKVVRNDDITMNDIKTMNPEAIIISPGPCTPKEAGVTLEVIKKFHETTPILGVCLGHQAIGEVFGGRTIRAPKPMHGKTSFVQHDCQGLFMSIPNPLEAARYHSLIVDLPANTPLTIRATAEDDGTIMAMRHSQYPTFGLQFHPESVMTEYGLDLMRNFLVIADEWNEKRRAA